MATGENAKTPEAFDTVGKVLPLEFCEDPIHADAKDREQWPHSASTSIVSAMGAVGLINFFYFPKSAHQHKGLAFVIPTLIFYGIVAAPMIYLEMFLGQYCGGMAIDVFRDMVPLFRGLGWLMSVTMICINVPYVAKFGELIEQQYQCSVTNCEFYINMTKNTTEAQMVFHQNKVDSTTIILPPIATVTILILYFGSTVLLSFKLRYSAYVCYILAPMAIAIFSVPCIRCLSLPNSMAGLTQLMHTDLKHLLSVEVWSKSAVLGLASLNVGFGFFHTIGSKNRFNLAITKPVMISFLIDVWVSFVGCIFQYSVSGYFMYILNERYHIHDDEQLNRLLLTTDPQLMISSILTSGEFSKVYSVCFACTLFIVVFTTSFLSIYPLVEYICLNTTYSILRYRPISSALVNGFLAVGSVILVVPVMKGIQAVLFSMFEANIMSMFLETIVVGWIYGKYRLREKIAHSQLIEYLPNPLLYVFIRFLVPLVMIISIITTLLNFTNIPNKSVGLIAFKTVVLACFGIFLLIIPGVWELKNQKWNLESALTPTGVWAPLPETNVTVALLKTLDKKQNENKRCC